MITKIYIFSRGIRIAVSSVVVEIWENKKLISVFFKNKKDYSVFLIINFLEKSIEI